MNRRRCDSQLPERFRALRAICELDEALEVWFDARRWERRAFIATRCKPAS